MTKPVESALRKKQAAINAIIEGETLQYLVKRLGSLEGGKNGRIFLSYGIPLYDLSGETIDPTLMKVSGYTHLGLDGREASILATMEREGIRGLMTHDQAFKRVPDIDMIDPV